MSDRFANGLIKSSAIHHFSAYNPLVGAGRPNHLGSALTCDPFRHEIREKIPQPRREAAPEQCGQVYSKRTVDDSLNNERHGWFGCYWSLHYNQ